MGCRIILQISLLQPIATCTIILVGTKQQKGRKGGGAFQATYLSSKTRVVLLCCDSLVLLTSSFRCYKSTSGGTHQGASRTTSYHEGATSPS